MTNRNTLTKSLHTVTAVSRLAHYLMANQSDNGPTATSDFVRHALRILGQPTDWAHDDVTFARCVEATSKLVLS